MINKFPISIFHFPIKSKFLNLKFKNSKTDWRLETGDWRLVCGISLIEILVTVSIFAILGILITRSIFLTVGGSKKSESVIRVRDGLNYSLSVMERQLRNANSILPSSCPNSDKTYLAYYDQSGNQTFFQCVSNAGIGMIASGSAYLTSSDINVVSCSLSCTPGTGTNPSVISISLTAKDSSASGTQNASATLNSQINLRNY